MIALSQGFPGAAGFQNSKGSNTQASSVLLHQMLVRPIKGHATKRLASVFIQRISLTPTPATNSLRLASTMAAGNPPSSDSSGSSSFWHSLRSAFDISNVWLPNSHPQASANAEAKLLQRGQATSAGAGNTEAGTSSLPTPTTGVPGTSSLPTPTAGVPGGRVLQYSGSAATARLELIPISNGQYINTLIIDRDQATPGGPATREIRGPAHPHDLLHDLNESERIPPSELAAQSHTVQVHDYGSDGMTNMAATSAPAPKKTLVLTHGYGAGLGFYFKNFYSLSQVPGYRTIAIDWLGMGLSSRPPFPTKKSSNEIDDRPERAEAFFVESLEEWRKAMKLESFVLAGHSLGGYLSVCYALKYPQRVEKLILLSPVGVPEPPNTMVTADGRVVTQGGGSAPSWAARLWEANVTPFTLIRALGPWGRGLINRYTTGRLGLEGDEGKEFADYMYAISVQRGSGEYALASLLLPGAWAKRPLAPRLPQLPSNLPITAIYGSVDWMRPDNWRLVNWGNEKQAQVRLITIPDAGHQLFLDNPSIFNKVLIKEMLEVTNGSTAQTRYGRRESEEGIRVWELH